MRSKTILHLHRSVVRSRRTRRLAMHSDPVLVRLSDGSVPMVSLLLAADALAAQVLSSGPIRHGGLPGGAPGGVAIATARFGKGTVRFVPPARLRGQASRSLRVANGWRIDVRKDFPRNERSMEVAYHVAGIFFDGDFGARPHDARNVVARALIMPLTNVQAALARYGRDLRRLATAFDTTEDAVRERLDDLDARDRAICKP